MGQAGRRQSPDVFPLDRSPGPVRLQRWLKHGYKESAGAAAKRAGGTRRDIHPPAARPYRDPGELFSRSSASNRLQGRRSANSRDLGRRDGHIGRSVRHRTGYRACWRFLLASRRRAVNPGRAMARIALDPLPVPTGESVATSRGMGFLTAMTNALVRAVARSWRQSRKIRETFS